MTALWGEVDQASTSGPPETLTTREAARVLRESTAYVEWVAGRGWVDGVKVGAVWLLDGASVRSCPARRRAAREAHAEAMRPLQTRPQRYVDAWPLLRQVDLAGGDYALDVRIGSAEKRALERARETGWLTEVTADHLAARVVYLSFRALWPSA